MLRAQRAGYVAIAGALDVCALVLAFLLALVVRDHLGNALLAFGNLVGLPLEAMVRRGASSNLSKVFSPNPLVDMGQYFWLLYLSVPAWVFFLRAQKAYDPLARRSLRQEFGVCAYAGLLSIVVVMVFIVLLKFDISRLLLLGFLANGIACLWVTRAFVLPAALRRGRQPVRHLVLVGSHSAARRFAGVLRAPAYRSSRLMGFIWDEAPEEAPYAGVERRAPIPHLGPLSQLTVMLDREVIDEVVLVRAPGEWATSSGREVPDGEPHLKWADVLELCLQRGRTVSLIDDLVPPVGAKVEATMTGSLPTLVLHNTPQNTLALSVKTLLDRTVAAFALLILAIPMAIIALLIKRHDGGPALFVQSRVGLNGRTFDFYKFRSMHVNAQQILETMKRENRAHYDSINIMQDPFFKAEDGKDPRITPVGRFIRKYSLDELPQFYNVLKGDMSLVGPRPPLPKEVAELEPWQKRKLSVKGGLTCIWQATGRNTITDADEWMRLDLEYIDNWSLWLDVKLVFQTLKSLVKPKGAS